MKTFISLIAAACIGLMSTAAMADSVLVGTIKHKGDGAFLKLLAPPSSFNLVNLKYNTVGVYVKGYANRGVIQQWTITNVRCLPGSFATIDSPRSVSLTLVRKGQKVKTPPMHITTFISGRSGFAKQLHCTK